MKLILNSDYHNLINLEEVENFFKELLPKAKIETNYCTQCKLPEYNKIKFPEKTIVICFSDVDWAGDPRKGTDGKPTKIYQFNLHKVKDLIKFRILNKLGFRKSIAGFHFKRNTYDLCSVSIPLAVRQDKDYKLIALHELLHVFRKENIDCKDKKCVGNADFKKFYLCEDCKKLLNEL